MRRWLSLLAGAALLVLAAGCGQTPSLTIQLGTSTVSIVRGDGDTVAVTITRGGGASDPVDLTVSGAPANVAVTFSDATLAAGASSTTVHLDVAAAATEGTTTITVHATSGSLAASADLALEVTSLTVDGTVQALLGDGFAGATVAIQGVTDTTDANGAFSISGVSVPYDVAVGTPYGSGSAGHLFVGMTSPNPVLTPYGALAVSGDPGYYPEATVAGDLSAPVPVGSEAKVCLEGATVAIYGCDTVHAGNTAYSISAMWADGGAVSFTLHALVSQLDANDLPTGYDGYGTATGSVTDGGTTTVNVTVGAAPATSNLTLTMNPPAGLPADEFAAGAELGSTFTMPVFDTNSAPAASITVPVPQFGGVTYGAYAVGRAPSGSGSSLAWKRRLPASGTATFNLDAPATLIAPADGATGIGTGDTLEISSTGGSPVTFIVSSYPDDSFLLVTTMDNAITIPDLTTVGVTLHGATTYTWGVYQSPTTTTMEEAATSWLTDYYGALLAMASGGPGSPLDAGTILATASRDFTTP